MKKSRYSEHQTVNILKQAEASLKVNDICRKYGKSDATLQLEIVKAKSDSIAVMRDDCREKAVERMRNRALPLPGGYAFDRGDANAR